MTTLTLKAFAKKLGFDRVNDARFQTFLKQWSIEGKIKVFQGGGGHPYSSHSTMHPRKIQLSDSMESFLHERILDELGLKIMMAARKHECSCCGKIIRKERIYAVLKKPFFLTMKICEDDIAKLAEGNVRFHVEPPKLVFDNPEG